MPMITDIVILAAGKGTRMQSALPKVLHQLAGQPMLAHVIAAADSLANAKKIIVTGHGAAQVEEAMANTNSTFVQQTEQLGYRPCGADGRAPAAGRGHSVNSLWRCALNTPATIAKMLSAVSDSTIGLLTIDLDDPMGYGRILRNSQGKIESIIEQKDASPEQLQITESQYRCISAWCS